MPYKSYKYKCLRKKSKRRSVVFAMWGMVMLVCLPFSSLLLNVRALVTLNEGNNISLIEATVNQYANIDGVEFTVEDSRILKSPSVGDDAYTLYDLAPYGYAIFLNETNSFMEGCFNVDAELPIEMDSNDTFYYGGPFNLFTIDDDGAECDLNDETYIDICTNEARVREQEVACHEISVATSNAVSESAQTTSTTSSIVSYYVERNYFEELTDYGNNSEGTCTNLACSILLGYYDHFVSNSYVPTKYEQGDGTSDALHRYLNKLYYGTENPTVLTGTAIVFVTSSVNIYLEEQGITSRLASEVDMTNSLTIAEIVLPMIKDEEKPLVISSATAKGADWNHTMVVYGVTYDTSNTYGTLIYHVQTGWHNSQAIYAISSSWVTECGYIECGLANHTTALAWKTRTATYHEKKCDCGYYLKGNHVLSNSINNSICTICGYQTDVGVVNSVDYSDHSAELLW